MYKWILSLICLAASVLAVGLLFTWDSGLDTNASTNTGMPVVQLDETAAQTIYKAKCLNCHGDQLQGAIGPNLQKIGSQLDEKILFDTITKGKGATMPSFKTQLKPEEIANMAKWLASKK